MNRFALRLCMSDVAVASAMDLIKTQEAAQITDSFGDA
jgi:hypothetical protein